MKLNANKIIDVSYKQEIRIWDIKKKIMLKEIKDINIVNTGFIDAVKINLYQVICMDIYGMLSIVDVYI